MAPIRYVVVRRVNDDNVVSAIMDANERKKPWNAEEFKDHLQRVTEDSQLVKIVCVDIANTPVDALERAWHE